MKKIILISLLFITMINADTLEKYYRNGTDNEMSAYLEKEMQSEAMACSKGSTLSCINLGIGSFADSAWRARELLTFFTPSGMVKKNAKKQLKRVVKKIYKKSKRITKNQIINRVVISGKENLDKTGIYKIVFKKRIGALNKRGIRKVGKYYIGKAERRTVRQRLNDRSKKWLSSIKSITVKYFPKSEVDKAERAIIGGATRFEDIYYKKRTSNYRNEPHNRMKHPKGKYFFEKEKRINGYKVITSVRNSNYGYIRVNNKKINLIRNGQFRSLARILSLLPKNLRNNREIRKDIVSARIQWRNLR